MTSANVSEEAAGVWGLEDALGDQDFDRLFRDHYRMVYHTAYGVLGNTPDAEDVAQTVFLRLSDGRPLRRLQPNPEAYLYRAAVNQSLNVIRQRKRNREQAAAAQYESLRVPTPSDAAEDLHKRL